MLDIAQALVTYYDYRGTAYELIYYHPQTFQSLGQAELEQLGEGINSWWDPGATEGDPVSSRLTARFAHREGGEPLQLRFAPALPPGSEVTWASIDGAPVPIELTPTMVEHRPSLTVTVDDGELTDSDSFILTVEELRIYLPLVMRDSS